MRIFHTVYVLVFCLTAMMVMGAFASAQAGDRPLYNSSGRSNSTTPYISGAKPLSLKQITQGKSTSGYTYSRATTTPYGTGGGESYLSDADIAAFRQRRAAEAQASEQQALASLAQGHGGSANNNPSGASSVMFPGQTSTPPIGVDGVQQQTKSRQIYRGRDTGVSTPSRVFNSVR